jgi:hypothetical protein
MKARPFTTVAAVACAVFLFAVSDVSAGRDAGKKEAAGDAVTVYLKHGGVVSGALVSRTKDEYIVDSKGSEYAINVKQIKRVEFKTRRDAEWPHSNDVVVKRANGLVLDGEIVSVDKDRVTLVFDEGGGRLEMGLERGDIDHLTFAPVCGKESVEIESRLKKQFPRLVFYKEGGVTVATDSYVTKAKEYVRTVNGIYTEIYLRFFRLFRPRKQLIQNYVVIFDDFFDYAECAIADGVPFFLAIGYFSPDEHVFYTFNAFGDRMEKMIFEVMAGRTGSIEEVAKAVKERIDKRYHIFVDGHIKKITDKYWYMYSFYKEELVEMTLSTLRHEFTHEIFHNWGLQSIILSKSDMDKTKLAEKKKEFLEAKDYEKKKELLEELVRLREKGEKKPLEMTAGESWLAEGIATYCETDPIGSPNERWLFVYQEAERKGGLSSIDFLTYYKMGSFVGLCPADMLNAYGESWALASFLMARYPDQFMDYQNEIATKHLKKDEDTLPVLLKCLNKDTKTVEKEFREYMKGYEKMDDPDVKRYMRYYNLWDDFIKSKGAL